MITLYTNLKQQATERISSHGAFGEHEYHNKLNADKLIELTAEEACQHLLDQKSKYNPDYQIGIELAVGMIKGKFNLK